MREGARQYRKDLHSRKSRGGKPRYVTVADDEAQAQYVVKQVLEARERVVLLRRQAVLFRSSHHSDMLELELVRRNIPYLKYGGLKFLEAAHVKDVLSVLKWVDNPRNRMAGFRALRLLPGIGPATASRLLDDIAQAADASRAVQSFEPAAALAADWRAFVALFRALVAANSTWPAELDAVIGWYEPHFERLYDDAFVRRGDLQQLQQIATTYASRERFLTELTLDPPGATSDEAGPPGRDDDYLILSTIHSAKGQEWKAVHVLNVVDGCIPSDMAAGSSEEVEEERRLLYVAMTRAKESLDLIVPQRFFVRQQSAYGDRHVYALRSRFIPDELTHLFECCASPAALPAEEPPPPAASVTVDIASRVRARWSGAR